MDPKQGNTDHKWFGIEKKDQKHLKKLNFQQLYDYEWE